MYFLVSASLLACDLARHPSGAAVADVVERVLALDPAELAALHGPAPEEVRDRVLSLVSDQPRMSRLMGGVAATVADGLPSPTVSQTLLEALTETLTGGLQDLLALLRRELTADAEPLQVALDAVTAAWAGRDADLTDLARLSLPWQRGVDPVPPALPEGPWSAGLRDLLDGVARRTPEQWARVVRAQGEWARGLLWSTAMHEACQAAYDADRLVLVARAQLVAARALRLSGASTGPDAHAVAMAVTGGVQAVCTADLLDTTSLLRAWRAGS